MDSLNLNEFNKESIKKIQSISLIEKNDVSDYFDEADFKEEDYEIIFNKFHQSVIERNLQLLNEAIIYFYQKISSFDEIPKELVIFINDSSLYDDIMECLKTCEATYLIKLFILLQFLTYGSDYIIIQLYNRGILHSIIKILYDQDCSGLLKYIFHIFGNACGFNFEIAHAFADQLFPKINEFLPHHDFKTRNSLLHCLFGLCQKVDIPHTYLQNIILMFKVFLVESLNINKHYCEKDISLEIIDLIIKILSQIIKVEESHKYIIDSSIINIIFGFLDILDQNIFIIAVDIVSHIIDILSNEQIHSLFPMINFDSLFLSLEIEDNNLINNIYRIFYRLITIDFTVVQPLVSRNIFSLSNNLINRVNYTTKISILRFLAYILITDINNSYSNEIISEEVIQSFAELAGEGISDIKECIGAITKLYTLTFDYPELNSLLSPYVIDDNFE